jgi:hypothetical protein
MAMIDVSSWIGRREEAWPRLRQAIQTTIAASLAYFATDAMGLSQ